MKKEEIFNELVEKALIYLRSAEAFIGKNIPAYIEEILNYRFYHELIYFSASFLSVLSCIFICWFSWKKTKDDFHELYVVLAVFSLAIKIMSLSLLIRYLLKLIQVNIAPRMYLIEYFEGI